MKKLALVVTAIMAAFFLAAMGKRPVNPPAPGALETTLKVEGMTCGGCKRAVETVLGRVPGVFYVKASHKEGLAKVSFDSARTSPEALAKVVNKKTEYRASSAQAGPGEWVKP